MQKRIYFIKKYPNLLKLMKSEKGIYLFIYKKKIKMIQNGENFKIYAENALN